MFRSIINGSFSACRHAGPALSSVKNTRLFASSTALAAQTVNKLGVVGAGQMGLGIALVAAQHASLPVTLMDSSEQSLTKSLSFADKLLDRGLAKNRITKDHAVKTRERLHPTTDLAALAEVDFIIEAVPESTELKSKLFSQLADVASPHTILATNTSSISITKIAAATNVSDPNDLSVASRVVATHFMNPVPVQAGVEIIAGLQTSAETLSTAIELVTRMGKIPSRSGDAPGFLVNRILLPYLNEAITCLENGIGNRQDIDSIMKHGTAVPMGPLQLADFIGLDTCLAILNVLHDETGDPKFAPSGLLRRMVDAGWHGKKSGKGFYDYA